MGCLSSFIENRLDPTSRLAARCEWSLRSGFTFFLSMLILTLFKSYIAIPFLLPVLVLVGSESTFGKTQKVSQSMYKGTVIMAIIASIIYYIPILSKDYWYIGWIYFSLITLFLTITLHFDGGARKLALAYHTIYTMNIMYLSKSEYNIINIWKSWTLVPIAICLITIGSLIPIPIFSYQQLIFIENKSIKMMQIWLKDMIKFFQSTDKMHHKISLAKLSKYSHESCINKSHLYSIYPIAKKFEMISDKNEILNQERFHVLYSMHYLSLAMLDVLKKLKYDTFYEKLIIEIKVSLETFIDHLLNCLETKILDDEETKLQLIEYNKNFLRSYKIARHKYLYNKDDIPLISSTNILHSFVYFLNVFTEKSIKYLELNNKWRKQKQCKKHQKCKLFFSLSPYDILYPFPYNSFKDFVSKLSPFIHWKSDIFLQSLAITISMSISSLLFIIPNVHNSYNLGYWSSLTIAFVSDTNIGGTFHTSILRIEGTFYGVSMGFTILQLIDKGINNIYVILLLTIWVIICGYYRSHPSRGYSGLVAAFTSALIVFGFDPNNNNDYTINYYAIRRIEMTMIGIAIILIILLLFDPNSARTLLNKDIKESLIIIKEMLNDSFKQYKIMINASSFQNTQYDNNDNDEKMDLMNHEKELKIYQSPNELLKKFQERKQKVTKLLESEKILINAAVFEPMFIKPTFNDEMYYKLNDIQFWLLRRCAQIDGCLRECLVYIEKSDSNHWLLNTDLIKDITPFINYLKVFEKCHNVIIVSMEYFIKEINNDNNNEIISYEKIMLELEETIDTQWKEFEIMMNEYIAKKSSYNIDNDHMVSTKGALLINALKFAVKNLMISLSQYAECKISY